MPRWRRVDSKVIRRSTLSLVALAAAVAALSGCSTTVVRKGVERRVEKRLTDLLGPAQSYRVRILDTRDAELVLGRARRVEISGKDIHAKGQFVLDSLKLTLVDLRYEGAEPYFVSVQRSDLEIQFSEQALNEYLQVHEARFKPHVEFLQDQVRVQMVYNFLGKPTPIKALGHFVIQEGRRLLFRADSADVAFLNTPGFGERFVEDRINPLLDLSRIEFPARLESIQVLRGRIIAQGSAAIPREVKD